MSDEASNGHYTHNPIVNSVISHVTETKRRILPRRPSLNIDDILAQSGSASLTDSDVSTNQKPSCKNNNLDQRAVSYDPLSDEHVNGTKTRSKKINEFASANKIRSQSTSDHLVRSVDVKQGKHRPTRAPNTKKRKRATKRKQIQKTEKNLYSQGLHIDDDTHFPMEFTDVDLNLPEIKLMDSSADEEIPNPNELLCSYSRPRSKPFDEDQIVWFKYSRYPYWPAGVRKIHYSTLKKKKRRKPVKISLVTVGKHPGGVAFKTLCMTLRNSNILPFSEDEIKFHELKQLGLDGIYAKSFDQAIERAQSYIYRRYIGKTTTLSVYEYFTSTDPLVGVVVPDKCSSSQKDLTVIEGNVVGSCGISSANDLRLGVHDLDDSSTSSDTGIISTYSDEDEQISADTIEQLRRHRERVKKLLQIINTKEVKTRLIMIYNEEIPSRRTEFYKQRSKKDNFKFKRQGFGPIIDNCDVHHFMTILTELYTSTESCTSLYACNDFCLAVWVPEALIYAIHKVDNVTLNRANDIFLLGECLTKGECDALDKGF